MFIQYTCILTLISLYGNFVKKEEEDLDIVTRQYIIDTVQLLPCNKELRHMKKSRTNECQYYLIIIIKHSLIQLSTYLLINKHIHHWEF